MMINAVYLDPLLRMRGWCSIRAGVIPQLTNTVVCGEKSKFDCTVV
jgi:hypothetical protein